MPGGGIIALAATGNGEPRRRGKFALGGKETMKKILALTLAAVMTAGMSTVAFAKADDETPVVGVEATEQSVLDSQVTPWTEAFVIDENGDATIIFSG